MGSSFSSVRHFFSIGGVGTSSSYEVFSSDDEPPSSLGAGLGSRHSSIGKPAIALFSINFLILIVDYIKLSTTNTTSKKLLKKVHMIHIVNSLKIT